MITLSKSDYKVASSCPQKLLYKKKGYETSNDTNEFMEMLAQGGYVVGKMATLLYPDGIEIDGDQNICIASTEEYLKLENCVLFEAAIKSGEKIVRIDILEKKGNHINIIEVKSISNDSDELDEEGRFTLNTVKNRKEYFEDVAYQYYVLSEKFPQFEYECYLMTPDKSKRTNINGLTGWFKISTVNKQSKSEIEELPCQLKPKFHKPIVEFIYEDAATKGEYIQTLKYEGILTSFNVTLDVLRMIPEVTLKAQKFIDVLKAGFIKDEFLLNKNCKGCEFRTSGSSSGYNECWGKLADTNPHIFDLYYGGTLRKNNYLNELINQKKTTLFDIENEVLRDAKGNVGSRNARQIIQIENTKVNAEWISNDLSEFLKSLKYPLHFIDFETYTNAIPPFNGLRPYELVAFQWSCHTIEFPGADPVHSEWINTSNEFPNFEFAISLMNQIGNTGTPFMWATHENTVLSTILSQLDTFRYNNPQLKDWLLDITKNKDKKRPPVRDGRFIDMNKMTLDYYFHPDMKGKTSIKSTLPAIWNNFDYLHTIPYFSKYYQRGTDGKVIDPYKTLSEEIQMDDRDDTVHNGGAAMKAYFDIKFNQSFNHEEKEEIRRQLLQYCELDTMAMVIIAYHWGINRDIK